MCHLPVGQYLHGDHGDQQPCLPSALHLCLYKISTSCLCFLMCTVRHMRVMRGHLASGIAGVQFADVSFLNVIRVNARKQRGWSTICCGAVAAPASTIYVKHLNVRIVAPKWALQHCCPFFIGNLTNEVLERVNFARNLLTGHQLRKPFSGHPYLWMYTHPSRRSVVASRQEQEKGDAPSSSLSPQTANWAAMKRNAVVRCAIKDLAVAVASNREADPVLTSAITGKLVLSIPFHWIHELEPAASIGHVNWDSLFYYFMRCLATWLHLYHFCLRSALSP